MAATDIINNNNLDSIFFFFTKPFIALKIFYFLWSNDALEKNSFFINLPVENLETELYTIRDDFVGSSMQNHIFRGTFLQEFGPHLFALIQQFLDASIFWNDDLWIHHTTNAKLELIQAIKATAPICAIRNPSTSLVNALKAHHTVYINRYISFFNDLPLKVGFMTNPFPGHTTTLP